MRRKKIVYAGLQLKRFFRLFPFVLIMSIVLCTAVINMVLVQLLYFPLRRVLKK